MEKQITLSGQILNYDETGPADGRPVILMHGWGCDHTTVRFIARLLEQGMHVFNLDLPGHGKSPEPSSVWGVPEYTACVSEFIDKLKLDNPVLVGHSFGGRISIMLSTQRPVYKMMLVDAAGIKPRRKPSYYFKVYSYKIAKHLLPVVFGKQKGNDMLESWRGKAGSSDYKNASPVMRQIMSKAINLDLTPLLPSIKAPTLLVWGENDTATPMRDARIMEKRIPDAGLVSFPGAGHFSFLDNPMGFAAVTHEFFKPDLK